MGNVKTYRKKPVEIQASQWFKHGDHPKVKLFLHPYIPGDSLCSKCGNRMHAHGWIDTLEDGHNVCPKDWIITGVKGEHYPCKPDIFDMTYDEVS